MPNKRTQKEKDEQKLTLRVKENFDKLFYGEFSHRERVIFSIYDKLKLQKKFASISFNRLEDSLQVDINPQLMKQKPQVIDETGKRMAIKMHLMLINKDPEETSEDYKRLAYTLHIWNYGPYPETPQKWHVYSCSRCGRKLLVYSKKLPEKSPVINAKTIWHNKVSRDDFSGNAHQGRYAYSGRIELNNQELQEILHNMKVIREKTDKGTNTDPTYYYEDEY